MDTLMGSISVIDRDLVTLPLLTEEAAAEIHAPLTFLDMIWLYLSPIQRLLFYEIPHLSRSQFVGDIITKLKDSLYLTLQYFPILAGNLIIHPNSQSAMPEIFYTGGNGVALTVAEWNNANDFQRLVADAERDCSEFYPLVPELKSSLLHHNEDSESVVSSTPVLALQVTLFPDVGLSIGISNHHAVGDARSIFKFMTTWAILHSKLIQDYKHNADAELLVSESLPVFDKNLIQRKKGLAKILLDQWNSIIKRQKSIIPESTTPKINKVRKTFVISKKEVKKLKKSVPNLVHVSSFTVICSYVWTCLLKSRQLINHEDIDDGENEHFLFVADCRERSDPPVPANYFGNCLVGCFATAKTAELAGAEGFQMAAELLGRTIHQKFMRKEAVFDGVETQMETIGNLNWERVISVAGSTRFNYYDLDFGWGNPTKFEFISIDQTGAISLNGCRGSDGCIEVGVFLKKPEMNVFSSIFMKGLNV